MYDALDEHLNVFIGASPNTTPILGYSGEGSIKDSIIDIISCNYRILN